MFSKVSYIYTLADPIDYSIRYVGQSQEPKTRFSAHKSAAKRTAGLHSSKWIKSLLNKGLSPILNIEGVYDLADIDFWEQHYISIYKSWGFKLTNSESGGKSNKTYSKEHKNKIGNSRKGLRVEGTNAKPVIQKSQFTNRILGVFSGVAEASKKTGVPASSIRNFIVKNKGRGGEYCWEYINIEEYKKLKFTLNNFKIFKNNVKFSNIPIGAYGKDFYKIFPNLSSLCKELSLKKKDVTSFLKRKLMEVKGFKFKVLE